jgi:hypothetical protein
MRSSGLRMVMTLSAEQIQAVKEGAPVTVTPPEVGDVCVLVRADVYALSHMMDEIDPRVAYPAVLKAWDSVGSPEDGELYRT